MRVNFLDLKPQSPTGARQAMEKAGWLGGELIITSGDMCSAFRILCVFQEKLEI